MAEMLPHFIPHADNAANAIGRRIRCLELASEPDFAMAFARATAFPELS